ncbi:ATP-binding cassette domain-containing protein, partial [Rossellomorea marisflavi]
MLPEVNATFKKGEFVSIVGTSGSGKSTLLSILG